MSGAGVFLLIFFIIVLIIAILAGLGWWARRP